MNILSCKISQNYHSVGSILLLLVFPSTLSIWSYSLADASGPYWLGNNFDPAYAYLLNSLSLSEGLQVGHSDHPGATLQWMGACILTVVNLLFGENVIEQDVLARPEFYLTVFHIALQIILSLSVFYAGVSVWKVSNKLCYAFLFQISPFLIVLSIDSLYQVSPEPLLLSFSILLSSFAIIQFYNLDDKKDDPVYSYGVISGLGVALKLTFFPLIFLPMIVLHGVKNRIKFLTVFSIIFLILVMNPLMGRLGFLLFLKNLVFREGYNKPINQNQSLIEEFYYRSSTVLNLLSSEFYLIIVTFSSLFIIFASMWNFKNKLKFHIQSNELRFTAAILIVFFVQFLFTVSGPRSHLHYFLPVAGLLGLLSIIVVKKFEESELNRSWTNVFNRVFVLIISFLVFTIFIEVDREDRGLRKTAMEWRQANDYIELFGETATPLVTYYRASNQAFSLDFGNRFSRKNYTKLLEEVYPDYYVFNIFNNKLYAGFGEKEVTIEEILQESEAVWVQGDLNKYIINYDKLLKQKIISDDVIMFKVNKLYSSAKESLFSITK